MNVLDKKEVNELKTELGMKKEENSTLSDEEIVALFNCFKDDNEKKYTIEEIKELEKKLNEKEKEAKIYLCQIDDLYTFVFKDNDLLYSRPQFNESIRKLTDLADFNHVTILIPTENDYFIEYYSGKQVKLIDLDNISSVIYKYYNDLVNDDFLFVSSDAIKKLSYNELYNDSNIQYNYGYEDQLIKLIELISKTSKDEFLKYVNCNNKNVKNYDYDTAYIENIIYNIKKYGKHKPIMK